MLKRILSPLLGLAISTAAFAQTNTVPISQLPIASPATGNEVIPIVQGGITRNISLFKLLQNPALGAGLDNQFGATQGGILYRGASAWSFLPPGTFGQFLGSGGAGANPAWTALPGFSRTTVADANYTVAATDYAVGYTSLTAARTVTLRAASSYAAGFKITVQDESGSLNASKYIEVLPNGTDKINGGAFALIGTAYGTVTLQSNGSNGWTTLQPVYTGDSNSIQPWAANQYIYGLGNNTLPVHTNLAATLSNFGNPRSVIYTEGNTQPTLFYHYNMPFAGSTNNVFPSAVLAVGELNYAGSQEFGFNGQCYQTTAGTCNTAEFDVFNNGAAPPTTFPPARTIGTSEYDAIGVLSATQGTQNGYVGYQCASANPGVSFWQACWYANPNAIASNGYGIYIDATNTNGAQYAGRFDIAGTGSDRALRAGIHGSGAAKSVWFDELFGGVNKFSMTYDGSAAFGISGAPVSNLDVGAGGMSVGTYAGVSAAPSNGAIISGNVGIGTNNPGANALAVVGTTNLNGTTTISSLTLSSALSVGNGGTGDTGTAWTSYTPTVSCTSGALTTATATGSYKVIGKTTHVRANLAITTLGTCGSSINLGLPNTANSSAILAGRETVSTGKMLTGTLTAAGASASILFYDNTSVWASGNNLLISGVYENQ